MFSFQEKRGKKDRGLGQIKSLYFFPVMYELYDTQVNGSEWGCVCLGGKVRLAYGAKKEKKG